MKVMPYGPRGWLLDVGGAAQVAALNTELRRLRLDSSGPWSSMVDIVPAAHTILVTAATPAQAADLRSLLVKLSIPPVSDTGIGGTVVIPVTYDGVDLAAVAHECGLTIEAVVAAHTLGPWSVAFGGFAPGFAYLSGGDPRLRVARLADPRAAVPAGAVALADGYSAIYPQRSPGGWRIIGHTTTPMWDARRESPALLVSGMRVQFQEAT